MKITKEQLKRIIKEEIENVVEGQSEMFSQYGLQGPGDWGTQSQTSPRADVKEDFKTFLNSKNVPSIIRGNDSMRKYAKAFLASDLGSQYTEEPEDFFKLFRDDYYQEDEGIPDAWDIGIYVER